MSLLISISSLAQSHSLNCSISFTGFAQFLRCSLGLLQIKLGFFVKFAGFFGCWVRLFSVYLVDWVELFSVQSLVLWSIVSDYSVFNLWVDCSVFICWVLWLLWSLVSWAEISVVDLGASSNTWYVLLWFVWRFNLLSMFLAWFGWVDLYNLFRGIEEWVSVLCN